MRPLAALLAISTLMMVPAAGCAQSASGVSRDSLVLGARYRATLTKVPGLGHQFPVERAISGELVALRGDSLVLRPHPGAGSLAIATTAVDRLYVSEGVSRGRSALAGAFGGALLGVSAGLLLYDLRAEGANFSTRWRAVGTASGALAAGGFVAGLVWPTERWKRVHRPR